MVTPHENHAVAVLDGKLYAVGGYDDDDGYLSSVERYDPALLQNTLIFRRQRAGIMKHSRQCGSAAAAGKRKATASKAPAKRARRSGDGDSDSDGDDATLRALVPHESTTASVGSSGGPQQQPSLSATFTVPPETLLGLLASWR